jgi:xylulokinase
MESTVLCADIGTTSLKAGLITGSGDVVSLSQQTFAKPDDVHASASWLPALSGAVKDMAARTDISGICAVSVSGNGPTIVSEDGTTLLWNTDIPPLDTAGTPAADSLFLPRILSFKSLFPSQYSASRFLFSGPEYFVHQLTGSCITVLPEERYRSAYWTEEQLASVSFPAEKLPPFVSSLFNAGNTLPAVTSFLGLAHPVPVFCCGPDFIAAMIGTDSLAPGKIYDCAGSSEGLNLCTSVPVEGPYIRMLPSVVPGLWNAAVLQTESGRMFVNFKRIVEAIEDRDISYEELIAYCIANPQSDGYDILELVAGNLRKAAETLVTAAEKSGLTPASEIVVTGGQAKNDQWMQMKCDTAGMALAVCNCADSELIGDAVTAQAGLGNYRSIREAAHAVVRITKRYTPGKTI